MIDEGGMEMNSVKKILMVEDCAVKIDSLKSELKIRGFNVVVVLDRNDTFPPSHDGNAKGLASPKAAQCGCDDESKCSCLSNVWEDGNLEIDYSAHILKKNGKAIDLTPNEFKILGFLAHNRLKVLTRGELVKMAIGGKQRLSERLIDSHVKNIRKKIEDNPKKPAYIITVRSIGYRFGITRI
jgi:DNA-binding response OmpR family regulator